jgi:E3 ubiquitin-protein ligase HUWE1
MEDLLAAYPVPEEKEMLLYTYVRLAHGFSDYATRLKSVQARLQALSVLIYSNQLTDSIQVICMMFFGSDIVSGIFSNAWDRPI